MPREKKLAKSQRALLFRSLFGNTTLKKGDIVKFRTGKRVWMVLSQNYSGDMWTIRTIGYPQTFWHIWKGDIKNLLILPEDEKLTWILRNIPFYNQREFGISKKELIMKLRELVKREGDFPEIPLDMWRFP